MRALPASPTTVPRPGPRRRRLPVLVVCGLTLALAAACLGSTPSGQTLSAPQQRRTVSGEFLNGTVDATNAFAVDLYQAVAPGAGNFSYSPYALMTSLAMARAGSAGATRDQFDRLLHTSFTPNLDEGLNALDTRIRERLGERRTATRKGRIELEQASALWGQRGTHVKADLLDLLAADYGAGFHVSDFHADAEGSRTALNNWAEETTHGLVKELVPRGGVNQYTVFLAATAAVLRAPWQVPFDPDKTRADPFRQDSGGTVDARMMELTSDALRRAEGEGWLAVELPYLGDEIALDLLAPTQGPLAALEARLTPELLADVAKRLDGAEKAPLDLRLPRFTFTTNTDLRGPLRQLGLAAAQDRDADFSGVSSDEVLSLSALPYEGVFGIDEDGTTARPDTASVEPAPPPLAGTTRAVLDGPFLFTVRDRRTGVILVIGRVTNPA